MKDDLRLQSVLIALEMQCLTWLGPRSQGQVLSEENLGIRPAVKLPHNWVAIIAYVMRVY